jgi:hypothetical protein
MRQVTFPPVPGAAARATASAVNAKVASMKRFALIIAAMAFMPSAFAAGIDSHAYTCLQLQGLIAASRFVYINNPSFGDFVVADRSYCSFSDTIQRRTVPTIDAPECPVNYCRPPSESRGSGS